MEKQMFLLAPQNKQRNVCIKVQIVGQLHTGQEKLIHKMQLKTLYKKKQQTNKILKANEKENSKVKKN